MNSTKFLHNSKKTSKVYLRHYSKLRVCGNCRSRYCTSKSLFNVKAGELVRVYPFNISALALNLGENRVGLVLCGSERFVNQNDIVCITGKLISISINPKIL